MKTKCVNATLELSYLISKMSLFQYDPNEIYTWGICIIIFFRLMDTNYNTLFIVDYIKSIKFIFWRIGIHKSLFQNSKI